MSRITIKLRFTSFTVQALSVIFANTFSSSDITNAARVVAMIVTVTPAAPLPSGRVAVAAGLARLTELSFRPVLTLVTPTHAGSTRRMIVTTAVYGTVCSSPAQITVTLVLRIS